MPPHRHLALAHRLQQRGLHLGRRAVDLIGEQDRMEDRAGHEFEASFLRAPDLGAGEVGRQQVRGELDAGEVRLQARGQGTNGGGLGQAGRAFHQQVAIGEQGDQQAFDQGGLADNARRQRVAQADEGRMQGAVVGAGAGRLVGKGRCVHRSSLTDRTPIGSPRRSSAARIARLHAAFTPKAQNERGRPEAASAIAECAGLRKPWPRAGPSG